MRTVVQDGRGAGFGLSEAGRSVRSLAWTGVLLGAAGLFVLNLVLGPIAIGLGIAALRRESRSGGRGSGGRGSGERSVGGRRVDGRRVDGRRAAAVASIALGAADVALELALVAVSLSHGALTWHFGA